MTISDQQPAAAAKSGFTVRPALLVPVLAVGFAALIGLVLIAVIGVSVPNAIAAFIDGTVGSPYAIAASLNRSTVFADRKSVV